MRPLKFSLKLIVVVFGVLWSSAALAKGSADDTIYQHGGFAIDGYDTVAYFTEDNAVKGKAEFSAEYKGAKWLFASAANRDLFLADPKKYAPQYEGYCAYAASQGYVAKTEGDQYTIVDGKLYLNYNSIVKIRWDYSKDDYITAGDQNWPSTRPGQKNGRAY